jgi:hypothetical protein
MEMPPPEAGSRNQQFGKKHNLSLSKNYCDWPERSLVLMEGTVSRLIQIYLESEKTSDAKCLALRLKRSGE